jgi:predicted ATP-dependent Lon-type protease
VRPDEAEMVKSKIREQGIHPTEKDFHLHLVELQNSGAPEALTMASFIALCSESFA